ncbi:MAG: Gfo/Idh/MocA family oxidoreductase, partial [Kiritimatiellaeota bacterium]|nr:Gfo/Idh/MocA family oxidoreductase [Kiritimatiellota bacterium]
LEAGMDVLVEKPMVMNCAEARRVMRVRDKTGRLLSVAFPGSFSPAIRMAKELIAAGEIGEVKSIIGYAHQNWDALVPPDSWKRKPEISGGGFLFDTGSHLVNTMVDLAGATVKTLSAVQDNRDALELSTAVSGRFANGVFFTLSAEGNSVNCQSRITILGTKGVLITGMYGELLRIIRQGSHADHEISVPPSLGVFEQFLRVRDGKMANPCPAEVGLRFATLIDMLRGAIANRGDAR